MVEKFDVYIKPLNTNRLLHVYLPKDYEYSDERYPVMYMYDGHNLFYDSDATYGVSWGLKDFLDNYDKKLIIVGIECDKEGNNRLSEYSPYTYDYSWFGHIDGYGDIFMDWVVNDLKPLIDNKYRTIPFRECTGIGGSSMGGLMAFYSVIKHNRYFSKAACLSSSIVVCQNELHQEIDNSDISPDTRIYMSFGTKETRNTNYSIDLHRSFLDRLDNLGCTTYLNVIKNGRHSEGSWTKENKIYLDFLWRM